MKSRVAIFASVSSPQQATIEKDSLPSQIRDGKEWTESTGRHVVAIYKVPGHTRKHGFLSDAEVDMEAYRRLHEDCEKQAFDILWCRARSRLGRTRSLIAQVEYLVSEIGNAEVFSAKLPHQIGQGRSHKLVAAIEGWEAEDEIDQLKDRHDFGMRARINRGLPASNWPHGYEPIRDESGKVIEGGFKAGEIEAIELATELFLDGKGFHSIAIALNESPYRPRQAKRWRYSTVRKILNNDQYAGLVAHGETRIIEPSDKFPALWDEATYRAILRERGRRHRGGSSPASPVSGLVICDGCKHHMVSLMYTCSREPYRIFRCRTHVNRRVLGVGCHSNQIRESVIIAALEAELRRLAEPGTLEQALGLEQPARSALDEAVEHAQAQVDAIETQRRRLVHAIRTNALDEDAVRPVNAELAAQLDTAIRELQQAQNQLLALPDYDARRDAFVEVLALPNLRSRPMNEVRGTLQRAGFRVHVKDRQIKWIEF